MERPQITKEQVDAGLDKLKKAMYHRLEKHGYGTFLSNHEIAGVVAEEYHELMDALRHDNDDEYRSELLDVAVAAAFGVICIDSVDTGR